MQFYSIKDKRSMLNVFLYAYNVLSHDEAHGVDMLS